MSDPSVKIGSIGGIIFTLIFLPWMDIEKAIVLSTIGAAVSFFVSLLLRRLIRKKNDA